ncbi:hypothetical protein DQ237_17055 [Blastococcus sp. TF02-8]|uniref:hypothetical protein n=1 Tax=Blastococcus sp. TF02-8 TaxID=2250574 RepID=UPI000DEB9EDE|nr:hypothetical protein [Blastococcus sp. TF02-8]RBY93676.1 hypothetical protein DQ237_17055 [Blastococcus sp. TF02-8]
MSRTPDATSARTPLRISLGIVLLLATLGSFGAGFGTMTDCTNTFDCTSTGCSPCATANGWLTGGWIVQGVLLLAGAALALLATRGVRRPAVRRAAIALGPLAVALFVLTSAVAAASY